MSTEIGFEPAKVQRALSSVQNRYNMVAKKIVPDTKRNYVDEIANEWASDDAVAYFAKFKAKIDSLYKDVEKQMDSIFRSVKNAAQLMANLHGATWSPTDGNLNTISQELDVSTVKAMKDNKIFINPSKATSIVTAWARTKSDINSELAGLKQDLNDAGFLSGDIQAAINHNIQSVVQSVGATFDAMFNEAKTEIDNTVSKAEAQERTAKAQAAGN